MPSVVVHEGRSTKNPTFKAKAAESEGRYLLIEGQAKSCMSLEVSAPVLCSGRSDSAHSPRVACFVAQYKETPRGALVIKSASVVFMRGMNDATHTQPAIDPAQTMVPERRSRMWGKNALFMFIGPKRTVLSLKYEENCHKYPA